MKFDSYIFDGKGWDLSKREVLFFSLLFSVKIQGKDNYRGNIPQSEVDKLLVDWENSKESND